MFYMAGQGLLIICLVISAFASMNVNMTFKRYSRIRNRRGLTAEQVAQQILQSAGINDVRIERIRGNLTDHYSPNEKVLRLSDSVYGSSSVAAIGVAAHECGHAIQHQVGYGPLKLRSLSVPAANFGSKLSWPLVLVGIILGSTNLAMVGVILFTLVVFFQLITLPVEFDASHRALKILDQRDVLERSELSSARKVLGAAALTYVAALVTSILQLIRLILIVQGQERRRG